MSRRDHNSKYTSFYWDIHWDVEKYKYKYTDYWDLCKNFMIAHKTKYCEERLVQLTDAFYQMGAHGVSYDPKTSRMVSALAVEVVEHFLHFYPDSVKHPFKQIYSNIPIVSSRNTASESSGNHFKTTDNMQNIADQSVSTRKVLPSLDQRCDSFNQKQSFTDPPENFPKQQKASIQMASSSENCNLDYSERKHLSSVRKRQFPEERSDSLKQMPKRIRSHTDSSSEDSSKVEFLDDSSLKIMLKDFVIFFGVTNDSKLTNDKVLIVEESFQRSRYKTCTWDKRASSKGTNYIRLILQLNGVTLAQAHGRSEHLLRNKIADAFITKMSQFVPTIKAQSEYYNNMPKATPKGPARIITYYNFLHILEEKIDSYGESEDYLEMVIYRHKNGTNLNLDEIISYVEKKWGHKLRYRTATYDIKDEKNTVICLSHFHNSLDLYKWLQAQKYGDPRYIVIPPGMKNPLRNTPELQPSISGLIKIENNDIKREMNGFPVEVNNQNIIDPPEPFKSLILFHDIKIIDSTLNDDIYSVLSTSFNQSGLGALIVRITVLWNGREITSKFDKSEISTKINVTQSVFNRLKQFAPIIKCKEEYFSKENNKIFTINKFGMKTDGFRIFVDDSLDDKQIEAIIDEFCNEATFTELVFKGYSKSQKIQRYAASKGLKSMFHENNLNTPKDLVVFHPLQLNKLKAHLERCGGENSMFKLITPDCLMVDNNDSNGVPTRNRTKDKKRKKSKTQKVFELQKMLDQLVIFNDMEREDHKYYEKRFIVMNNSLIKSGLQPLEVSYFLNWQKLSEHLSRGEGNTIDCAKKKAFNRLFERLKSHVYVIQAREEYFGKENIFHNTNASTSNSGNYRIITRKDISTTQSYEKIIDIIKTFRDGKKTDQELIFDCSFDDETKEFIRTYSESMDLAYRFFSGMKDNPDLKYMVVYHHPPSRLRDFKTLLQKCGGQNLKYKLIPPPHENLHSVLGLDSNFLPKGCQVNETSNKFSTSQSQSSCLDLKVETSNNLSILQPHPSTTNFKGSETSNNHSISQPIQRAENSNNCQNSILEDIYDEHSWLGKNDLIPIAKTLYMVKFIKEDSKTENDSFKLLESTCSNLYNISFKYALKHVDGQWKSAVILVHANGKILVGEGISSSQLQARILAAKDAVNTIKLHCNIVEPNFSYFAEGGEPAFIVNKYPIKTSTYEILERLDNVEDLTEEVADLILNMFKEDKTIEDVFFLSSDYSDTERDILRRKAIEHGLSWRLFGQGSRSTDQHDTVSTQHLCIFQTKSALDLVKELVASGGSTEKYSVVTNPVLAETQDIKDEPVICSKPNLDQSYGSIPEILEISDDDTKVAEDCYDEKRPGGCCKPNCKLIHRNILDVIVNNYLRS